MSRERFVFRNGQMVTAEEAWSIDAASRHGTGPAIISDTMAPIRSMADGRVYDSKSRYAQGVRAAGCEIVGNDLGAMRARPVEAPPVAHDIKRAIAELSSR